MKKRLISTLLVAAMAVSLVACGGGDKKDVAKKSDSESKKSTNTDVLNINLASEPAYLDPALNSSVDGGCLAVNSFVGLYTYNKDGKLVPALSDGEPEISEDKTTYTLESNVFDDMYTVIPTDATLAFNLDAEKQNDYVKGLITAGTLTFEGNTVKFTAPVDAAKVKELKIDLYDLSLIHI